MKDYSAPKPDISLGIMKYLRFLPPFCLWRGIKLIFNIILGNFIGNIVNEGQLIFKNDGSNKNCKNNRYKKSAEEIENDCEQVLAQNRDNFNINSFKVHTFDNVSLKTLEILHKKNHENKKYFFSFIGRGSMIEHDIRKTLKLAKDFDMNIVTYNHRGIYNSSGKATHYKQLINDGIAQVQRLLDKGIEPENIILYGHCVGGAVATFVAEYFHKRGKRLYLFDDRVYTSVPDITTGLVKNIFEQKGHPIIGEIGRNIIHPILWFAIKAGGWNMNIIKAYKSIPEKYKDYFVIRSSKEERKKQIMMDDGVIDHKASLHYELKRERRAARYDIKKTIKYAKEHSGKELDVATANEIIRNSNIRLVRMKAHKMKGYPNPEREHIFDKIRKGKVQQIGHTAYIWDLRNRVFDINGQQYIKKFIMTMEKSK